RKLVKAWQMGELTPELDKAASNRNFERGRDAFIAGQCIKCHRMGDVGGGAGPDITAVSSRFTRRDILESILEPSKVISDQYQNIVVTKSNGDDVIGRLVEENEKTLVLVTNPLTGEKTDVRKRDVRGRQPSQVSAM